MIVRIPVRVHHRPIFAFLRCVNVATRFGRKFWKPSFGLFFVRDDLAEVQRYVFSSIDPDFVAPRPALTRELVFAGHRASNRGHAYGRTHPDFGSVQGGSTTIASVQDFHFANLVLRVKVCLPPIARSVRFCVHARASFVRSFPAPVNSSFWVASGSYGTLVRI